MDKLPVLPVVLNRHVCALVRGGYNEATTPLTECPCIRQCDGGVQIDTIHKMEHTDSEVHHTHRMPLIRCQAKETKSPPSSNSETSDARAVELFELASTDKARGTQRHTGVLNQKFNSNMLNQELTRWWIKQTPDTHHRFNFGISRSFLDFMVSSQ
jgi:hypothetical protein